MSALTDRLRGIVAANRASPPVQPPSLPNPAGPDLSPLGGTWRDGCFLVERRVPRSTPHGRASIGELAAAMCEGAHEAPLVAGGAPARSPFVFLDLETTGLHGGAGTHAFLVGCGWFDEDLGFTTRQYLLAQFAGERPLLDALAAELGRAGALVSFNGKSFDAPVLETRYLFHRLDWMGAGVPHVDILHPARRFWRDEDCSLAALEAQVLAVRRRGDVAGFEIPGRYFQFVRTGDARPLSAVLEHNRLDLLSLAGLTARLLELIASGPDRAADAREALALGRTYARGSDDRRALGAYERAVMLSGAVSGSRSMSVRHHALRALALSYRRARRYDEAARCWTRLLSGDGCPGRVEREALEALAIHHEHRLRDLASAKDFALRSLERDPPSSWAEAVAGRLRRIERKLTGWP